MEGHGVGQAKTKRARTSFKHHQLRIMKAHFQVNQNPDSRELKMLSQKTGLDKKVLQVRRVCCCVYKMYLHGPVARVGWGGQHLPAPHQGAAL